MTVAVFGIIVLALLAFIAWRDKEHRAERAELLQRIQDPERAVAQYQAETRKEPPRPPRNLVSDDEAMAEELKRRREA